MIRLDEFLEGVERELLERALKQARGNKSQAARLLGINRTRLLGRLKQLALETPAEAEIEFELVEDDTDEDK
jgi:DNA-binding NtrC family response regulator